MAGSQLLLAAEDLRLASSIQSHLTKTVGLSALACPYPAVRNHFGSENDGLLLLVCDAATECYQIERLVQEISLCKWRLQVAVLQTDANCRCKTLDQLKPYIHCRLCWPEDAMALAELVDTYSKSEWKRLDPPAESVADVVRRRLQAHTPSLLPLVERIALAAAHDVTVLLTGETGTGKTFLARLVHDCSPRQEHRFLMVPCGALAANLIESEFFGHTRGAFTGADRPKLGKFAVAGQGTLLLDEIDALGHDQQANLLRVIETGEYEAVGSNETQKCTARIVVASNLNLEEAVESGRFRRDLYYRLNVMSFHLPPLRERVQDIAPLVRGMAARFNLKFRKDLYDISPEAMAALEAFPWPGNIRQLENVIQHAVLVSSGPELRLQHLPQPIQDACVDQAEEGPLGTTLLARNREILEKNVIHRTLVNCNYSRARAAHVLGISRVTLYKKMKKYNLMTVPLTPSQS